MTEIKEIKVIKVSKKVYNIIRSIIESSMKKDYHWNIPIYTPSGVKFTKYKDTRTKQWEINIIPLISSDGKKIGTAIRIIKMTRIADFIIRELCFEGETSYTLMLHNHEIFNIDTIFDLEPIYIIADVPFNYHICLVDLIEKLLFYFYIAEQAKVQKHKS